MFSLLVLFGIHSMECIVYIIMCISLCLIIIFFRFVHALWLRVSQLPLLTPANNVVTTFNSSTLRLSIRRIDTEKWILPINDEKKCLASNWIERRKQIKNRKRQNENEFYLLMSLPSPFVWVCVSVYLLWYGYWYSLRNVSQPHPMSQKSICVRCTHTHANYIQWNE